VVHAAGNIAAVALYSLSLMARWRGRRRAGLALSALGAGMMTFGAYLGGHLAYRRGVGVDQTTFEKGPADWVGVIDLQALREEKPSVVSVEGTQVLLYRRGDSVYGISDRCGHRGCALHEGFVDNHQITCPCHGSTFRLRDGSLVRGPATAPQPVYQARLRDGRVELRRPPD
jgi:nitrite reductase/ring-hydroxylating ferredoxin subunit